MGLGREDDSLPPQLVLDLVRASLTSTAKTFEDNYTSTARDTTSGRMATWECKGEGRVKLYWQVFKGLPRGPE